MNLSNFSDNQRNVISWYLTKLNRMPSHITFSEGVYNLDLGYGVGVTNENLFDLLNSASKVVKGKLNIRDEVFLRKCALLWWGEIVTQKSLRDHCDLEDSRDWLIEHAARVEILLDK